MNVSTAPFQSPTSDYAVEADIEVVRAPSIGGTFGVYLRGKSNTANTGYLGGVVRNQATINVGFDLYQCNHCLAPKQFNPEGILRTYRLEAKANHFRLLIGNAVFVDTYDNQFLTGDQSGVWADEGIQISVHRFTITPLP
jgi:hypothetical protein